MLANRYVFQSSLEAKLLLHILLGLQEGKTIHFQVLLVSKQLLVVLFGHQDTYKTIRFSSHSGVQMIAGDVIWTPECL